MTVDLVVLNAHPPDYQQDLADRITAAVFAVGDSSCFDRPGGVFLRRRDLLGPDELLMLRATARAHIPCDGRSLGRILATAGPGGGRRTTRSSTARARDPRARAKRLAGGPRGQADRRATAGPAGPAQRARLAGDARTGRRGAGARRRRRTGSAALAEDGQYEIQVQGDRVPPAPWSNVIANPHGGFWSPSAAADSPGR